MKKKISIVTPVYNESLNIEDFSLAVKNILINISDLDYEHIFIDNGSGDGSQKILKNLAKDNKKIKVILNRKNFGYIRSSYHALMQATGDAVVLISCDFQDPPELINDFISNWRLDKKIILGQKSKTKESFLIAAVRSLFYRFIKNISDDGLTVDTIGFGLFDRKVIEDLRGISDCYPYFRGLITETGHEICLVPYQQPERAKGISKLKFFDLYDLAITGIIKHSKLPIRIMAILGFLLSFISILSSLVYLIYKLLYWNSFSSGITPILLGVFILGSFQILFIGLLGEYILSIFSQNRNMPLVFEKERINFDS